MLSDWDEIACGGCLAVRRGTACDDVRASRRVGWRVTACERAGWLEDGCERAGWLALRADCAGRFGRLAGGRALVRRSARAVSERLHADRAIG